MRSRQVKSLMLFLQEVLHDLEDWCGTSTIRDLKTITDRVEHEGLSFLTITLTDFGKDFEKSLDRGQIDPNSFPKFHKGKGGMPRFLQGFLSQVFDEESGRLLNNPSVTCIWAVRQLTLMCGKIMLPCTSARQLQAIRRYVECEDEVRKSDANLGDQYFDRFKRIGVLLWADLFSGLDKLVHDSEILPKHGPGATAERLLGNEKWRFTEWTERLEEYFPAGEYLLPNWRHYKRLSDLSFLDPGQERPTRVTLVPKTLKTPRVIAIEPVCMQYVQLGLMAAIREAVRRDDILHSFIGTESQVPNQHLAREGSRNGALATLDLSEASDRVSNQHVRGLLRNHKWLQGAVDSCRSRKADVPGHGVIRLAKFASMGSGLTFDMEAMVFLTIVFTSIEADLSRPLTRKDFKSYVGRVRVYGDDIVVPVEHVQSVVAHLEAFGLKVNASKSFWSGKFRESCGKEYYDGQDVSVARVRRTLPTNRQQSAEIVSAVSLRNQMYNLGCWRAARWLDSWLGRLIPMPRVAETSPVLGRHSFLGYDTERICDDLHRPLVRGMMVRPVIPKSILDDVPALLKVLVTSRELPNPDAKHLMNAGRPKRVNTKLGWGPSH
jgi:hypothetical protein